ncbi:MAG: GNAT family N-acetyltransferase [Spirochaetaceae bacterium]|nr:GNAT family N-acetyltransferase [Spirochaetaceae bacterium]
MNTPSEIKLIPATEVSYHKIVSFLKAREQSCVQLFERTEQSYVAGWPKKLGDFVCLCQGEKLLALIFASKAGLILHCFSSDVTSNFFVPETILLGKFFSERKVYCISGEANGTNFIVNAIENSGSLHKIVEVRDYKLMIFDTKSVNTAKHSATKIKLCTLEDLEALYPLQHNYDIVEVLPHNRPFNEKLCRNNLLHALGQHRVYAVPCKKNFAAKAAVSAISPGFVQIGGVFTMPEYRCQGYARSLVYHIAQTAKKAKKGTVLFVRNQNTAAICAYNNAGFCQTKDYKIIYY